MMIDLTHGTPPKILAVSVLGIALVGGLFFWERRAEQAQPLSSIFPRTAAYDFDPPEPGSYKLPAIKHAPEGTVLGQTGETLKLSGLLKGRISLVSFVYLMCSDEEGCPLALSSLFSIYDTSEKAPQLRKDVQLVMISFDPKRDTAEAIDAFAHPMTSDPAKAKKLKWQVLTTKGQADLKPILKGFGQAVNPSADGETINHLLRMFLVDRSGRIRNIYGLGMIDPRLIMTDVETLLLEEKAS